MQDETDRDADRVRRRIVADTVLSDDDDRSRNAILANARARPGGRLGGRGRGANLLESVQKEPLRRGARLPFAPRTGAGAVPSRDDVSENP